MADNEWNVSVSALRDVGIRLDDLKRKCPAWAMRSQLGDTVYCLPVPVIDRLAFQDQASRAFLDPVQATAEREFTALCEDFSAIGVVGGNIIVDTPLTGC